MSVRPKKHLGQHFLKDLSIAERIAGLLSGAGYNQLLEIGPGTGVLTQFLIDKPWKLTALDLDQESIEYLEQHYSKDKLSVRYGDVLKVDFGEIFGPHPFAIVGNFPYNISSQIVFKTLEWRHQIPEFCGMFQKEVAERICASPGSKTYGILSVLTQAFYQAHYHFTVPPGVFHPPPKVDSGVLSLIRHQETELPCSETLFFKVVKTSFQQRRKTLRNSLKTFNISQKLKEDSIFARRPEQLSVAEFITLTQKMESDGISTHS
jgi:16S rRNA (adenine1518-N6/adenine1519-N6)-dimethyltransferase